MGSGCLYYKWRSKKDGKRKRCIRILSRAFSTDAGGGEERQEKGKRKARERQEKGKKGGKGDREVEVADGGDGRREGGKKDIKVRE